jgi:hypothetical protein
MGSAREVEGLVLELKLNAWCVFLCFTRAAWLFAAKSHRVELAEVHMVPGWNYGEVQAEVPELSVWR